MNELTEQQFLKDTAEHQMTILQDEGTSRHIRFRKPGTICMGFDMITWPGYLCYTGDMGTYVFSRSPDMLEFFRTSGHCRPENGETLPINFGYWAEKLQAVDKQSGLTEYSPEKFRETILEILEEKGASGELRQAVKDDVLCAADDGHQAAYEAASCFRFEGRHVFPDFWEHSLSVYTVRFLWCCYALAWGIQKYDQAKKEAA